MTEKQYRWYVVIEDNTSPKPVIMESKLFCSKMAAYSLANEIRFIKAGAGVQIMVAEGYMDKHADFEMTSFRLYEDLTAKIRKEG